VYDLLKDLSIEQLLLMMAKAGRVQAKKYISLYLTRLREVRIDLTGEDLKKMGIPAGPRYKRILTSLLDAKLDGEVKTRDDELAFVAKAFR